MRPRLLFILASIGAFAIACERAPREHGAPAEFGVSGAVYVLPAADGPAVVYFTVHNPEPTADTLLGVTSAAVRELTIHATMTMGEGPMAVTHMTQQAKLVVPAKSDLRFAPGVNHVMAAGPLVPMVRGDTIVLTMRFAKHTPLTVVARVLNYADYDSRAPESKH
jgi:copper(I)-binding protein